MTVQIEFSRTIRLDTIGPAPRPLTIEADEAEREALARRFDLLEIDHLSAELDLSRNGEAVTADGRMRAVVTQSCVASGKPVPATIDEPFRILFSSPPEGRAGEEEIELSPEECDVVFYEGTSIDIGEAVAETLLLSLDPWPRAPDAEEALKAAGIKREEEVGPFAALAALKDKLGK